MLMWLKPVVLSQCKKDYCKKSKFLKIQNYKKRNCEIVVLLYGDVIAHFLRKKKLKID